MSAPPRVAKDSTGPADVLLRVEDLHAHYGAIHALQGISLTVCRGQIVTLLGANGAGKSTTLRVLSGLVRPTRGSVVFDGRSLVGLAPHRIVRMGLVHVPEGRGIFPELTVAENLDLGMFARSDRQGAQADRERMLQRLPRLRERLKQVAGTLSGGEQQMLAIARAVVAGPRLLLLDEPSLGLAPQIVEQVFDILAEINASGVTLLLVEQNAHLALRLAHEGYVLESGRLVLHDRADALSASDRVRQAYLGG